MCKHARQRRQHVSHTELRCCARLQAKAASSDVVHDRRPPASDPRRGASANLFVTTTPHSARTSRCRQRGARTRIRHRWPGKGGQAKCVGAAAEVTVVVVCGRVVVVVVLMWMSTVLMAPALYAAAAAVTAAILTAKCSTSGHRPRSSCCQWRRIHRRSRSSSGSRSHAGLAVAAIASSKKWRPPVP